MRVEPGGEGGKLMAQRVLGESLRMLFGNFGTLFTLALAPSLLMEAVFLAVADREMVAANPGALTPGIIWAALISSLAGQVIVALVTLASVDGAAGHMRSLDFYFRTALNNLLPIVVLGTIVSVLAGFAAMFFLLPGLYVYAVFLVWLPCILYEKLGYGALGRAQRMSEGHRWPLVGAIGALILIFLGVVILLGPVWAAIAAGAGGIIAALLSAAISALSYAIIGVFSALVYLRMRFLEDGTTANQVAESV